MRARLAGIVRVWAAFAAVPGCVVIDDPNHCANRDGDATCQALFDSRPVCSVCRRSFSGCEAAPVDPACRADGAAASGTSSGSTTSAGSDTIDPSSTSSGTPVPCEGEGESATCPEARPYCIAGECSGCDAAGGDAFCMTLSADTPQCSVGWGRCVECVDATSPVCVAEQSACTTSFTCGACTRQDQCPDSACNPFTGACMDDAEHLWIDENAANCADLNAGSEAAPLCTLGEALARTDGSASWVFHLGDGTYDDLRLVGCSGKSIAVLGTSGSGTQLSNASAPGLDVECNNTIILRRVRLLGFGAASLQCMAGAKVALEQVQVADGEPAGILVEDCDLIVDRSRVVGAPEAALDARSSSVVISSSLFATAEDAAASAVTLDLDGGEVQARFATIVGTGDGIAMRCTSEASASTPAGIDCEGLALDVQFERCAVDDSTILGENNARPAYDPAWFIAAPNDLRLGPGAVFDLEGVGRWDLGDPALDYDGDPWPLPPGRAVYPGGDQPAD
jgi:hypothetical protein